MGVKMAEEDPTAYRCTICLTDWPPDGHYLTCPECREPTRPSWQQQPLEAREALLRKRWAEFARYQERRGDDEGLRPEVSILEQPPLPEQIESA